MVVLENYNERVQLEEIELGGTIIMKRVFECEIEELICFVLGQDE